MVQDRLELEKAGTRVYLVLHAATERAAHTAQPLGFQPARNGDALVYRKVAHPALVRQVFQRLPALDAAPDVHTYATKDIDANRVTAGTDLIEFDPDLLPYQKNASLFLAERRRAMLALSPRLGKTVCALRAARAVGSQHVRIIAPLSLLGNWEKECQRWYTEASVAVLWPSEGRDHGWLHGPEITIASYDYGLKHGAELLRSADLVIFDESVLLKNRETKRFRGGRARRGTGGRSLPETIGYQKLLRPYRDAVWMLTGGPTTRFLDDLWAQMHLLQPTRFPSYWDFAQTYCVLATDQWGTRVIANKPNGAAQIEADLGDIYYARTIHQVTEIPDWIPEIVEVEMDGPQAKMYRQMEKDFLAELPSGDTVLASSILAQMVRLEQLASNPALLDGASTALSPKDRAVIELVDVVERPVLVWTNFIATAERLTEILGKNGHRAAFLTGSVKPEERQAIVDQFQSGQLDILVAHPGVGKYGHTLSAARSAIYVERDFNGDNFYQSLFRIRHIKSTNAPRILFLLSTRDGKRTIDHVIHAALERKYQSNITLITARLIQDVLEAP